MANIQKKPCIVCGRPFVYQRSTAKYCSDACRCRKASSRRAKAAAQACRPRPCAHCGKVFTPKRKVAARFCSKRCSLAAHRAGLEIEAAARREAEAARNRTMRRILARRLGERIEIEEIAL